MRNLKKITAFVLAVVMCVSFAGCSKKNNSKAQANQTAEDFSDYNDVIQTLLDSKVNGDLDKFMILFGDMEALMKSVVTQEVMDETKANYTNACGDNIDVQWNITNEDVSSEEELVEYQDTLELFGEKGELEEAVDLTIDVNAKGDAGSYSYEMTCSVGKIDGKWLICNFNDTLLK